MKNIIEVKNLISPENLKKMIPLSSTINNFVEKSRKTVQDIISGKDDRIIIIVGPCSIHDTDAAFEYSKQLVKFQKEFPNLFIVMRVYFEKPRTRTGWKGLINDPDLDNSLNVQKGLYLARELLVKINQIGLPTACEFLENNTPMYFSDLVSWGAIGARTVTSQIHRQLASGLSMPIGFKNFMDGNFNLSIDGILSSFNSHTYPGINENGENCLFVTKGNKFNHLILRGGSQPNYYPEDIQKVKNLLNKEKIKNKIIIDCSHGNSGKDFNRQSIVCHNIANQIEQGEKIIAGVMIESFIKEGNQKITNNLEYGVSITDSCISLETTRILLKRLNQSKEQLSKLTKPDFLFKNLEEIREKLDEYKKNIIDIIKGKSNQLKILQNRYSYNSIHLDLDYKIVPELVRLIKNLQIGSDEIELLNLILDRIYLGMIVAEIKFNNNPFKYLKNNFDKYFSFIEDKKREKEILNNFLIPGVKDLFSEIIFDSKLIQLEYLKQRVKNIKIGYLGPKGTFSSEACEHFNKNISFIPCLSFDILMNNFENKKIDYILLPIFNNITGNINVLKNENYTLLGKINHKINLAILSPNIELIKNKEMIIYSHPQAYLEVKSKLKKLYPEHKFIETKSTFKACLKAISENQYSLASINNQSIFMNKINLEELEKDNKTEFGLFKI